MLKTIFHGLQQRSVAALNTTVTFVDRAASQEAASQNDTQMALAQLYAHISSMPESSKKRKLLKQVGGDKRHLFRV